MDLRAMMDDAYPTPTLAPAFAPEDPERLESLAEICTDDALAAFGLNRTGRDAARRTLEPLFRMPARRLARQAATYDRIVGEGGLSAGGSWAMERMARRMEVEGLENVPREGPLLLVANHPGLGDSLALFASVPRRDLRVVAAERPFLDALPNTSRHLITVPEDSSGRLGAIRTAGKHLRSGAAVLTFPGGKIEPDPEVLPGAVEALEHWSGSVGLFARLAPGLRVVPAVVSGVLSPTALRNPLIFLRRKKRDREWLAATIQMMVPMLRNVTTKVAFGRPIRAEDLPRGEIGRTVLAEARRLMEHCAPR